MDKLKADKGYREDEVKFIKGCLKKPRYQNNFKK